MLAELLENVKVDSDTTYRLIGLLSHTPRPPAAGGKAAAQFHRAQLFTGFKIGNVVRVT